MELDVRIRKEYESAKAALSRRNFALAEALLFQAEKTAKELGISSRKISRLKKDTYQSCANNYLRHAYELIEDGRDHRQFKKVLSWTELFAKKANVPHKNRIKIVKEQARAYNMLQETWHTGNPAQPVGKAIIYSNVESEATPYSFTVLKLPHDLKKEVHVAKNYRMDNFQKVDPEEWDLIEIKSDRRVPESFFEKFAAMYKYLWKHPLYSQKL